MGKKTVATLAAEEAVRQADRRATINAIVLQAVVNGEPYETETETNNNGDCYEYRLYRPLSATGGFIAVLFHSGELPQPVQVACYYFDAYRSMLDRTAPLNLGARIALERLHSKRGRLYDQKAAA